MNEKLKYSDLKKTLYLVMLLIVLILYGCDLNENDKVYRRQITIETNLSYLRIGALYLDSTFIYPYILSDEHSPNLLGYGTKIYPVQDTGVIKLNIYGGDGYNSKLLFKDSITIYTPSDTVYVEINDYHFFK